MHFRRKCRFLAAAVVCIALAGCEQSSRKTVRTDPKTKDDPTSWSASPLTVKGADDSESRDLSGSSETRRGSLSKRGADIERSLGISQ